MGVPGVVLACAFLALFLRLLLLFTVSLIAAGALLTSCTNAVAFADGVAIYSTLRALSPFPPSKFKNTATVCLTPAINKWERLGIGLHIEGKQLNHAVYADNIILLAESELEAAEMIDDVAKGITAAGYEWRPDSLEVLPCGDLIGTNIQLSTQQDNSTLLFKTVHQLQLLGNIVSSTANTKEAMRHRLTQTEKGF